MFWTPFIHCIQYGAKIRCVCEKHVQRRAKTNQDQGNQTSWGWLGTSVAIKHPRSDDKREHKQNFSTGWSFSFAKFNDHNWIASSVNSCTVLMVLSSFIFAYLLTTTNSRMMQSNILWFRSLLRDTTYLTKRRCTFISVGPVSYKDNLFYNEYQ